MQINLNGHHVDLTDSLQDYVNTKFEKLERFFDHITMFMWFYVLKKTVKSQKLPFT
ncbi:ribosome hibernation protein YhbH [Vibrio astriarenae]|nr:ribosome hibernation protein YhbH [Vibrio sp. C7]